MSAPAPNPETEATTSSSSTTTDVSNPTSASRGSMTASERRIFGKLSVMMSYYHNHFKHTFREIWDQADEVDVDEPQALREYLHMADGLYTHLDAHHSIEERYFFPLLSKRMPQFTSKTGRHLKEHAQMHDGLLKYHAYITACLNSSGAHYSGANSSSGSAGNSSSAYSAEKMRAHYSATKMRTQMQVFEKVLFEHMDEEVRSLSAESMWEAGWSEREMGEFPM